MIVCISANPAIDRRVRLKDLVPGSVNRAISAESFAGGKAAHVAMAAKALGEDVIWIGFLGGATGDQIERQLRDLGIEVRAVRTKTDTRTNAEIIDESGRITEILEPGGAISSDELEQMYELCHETFAKVGSKLQVVLSGSLPPNVPSDLYHNLIIAARESGGKSILDTSGAALLKGLEARPDVVKPNSEEAANATEISIDGESSSIKALRALRNLGSRAVALSLGSQGVLWTNGSSGKILRGVPPTVKVISTVGCGDATAAGLAVAGLGGLDEAETLRLAVSCGTANCLASIPGQIKASDVQRLMGRVSITEVESGEEN